MANYSNQHEKIEDFTFEKKVPGSKVYKQYGVAKIDFWRNSRLRGNIETTVVIGIEKRWILVKRILIIKCIYDQNMMIITIFYSITIAVGV